MSVSVSDVIILTGPPGAGKSTTARTLATEFDRSVHLHTDDFWHYIVAGAIAPFLPESDVQNQTVLRVVRAAAFTYAAGGYTVIVDGIVGPWMLHHFRAAEAPSAAARLHYVVLRPSRNETLRRATQRTAPDVLTDERPITALRDQFDNLGRFEGHAIDTTAQSASDTVAAVRDAVGGGRFVVNGSAID